MGIIPCALDCKFQNDGYCNLNFCSTVNSVDSACPYFDYSLTKINSATPKNNISEPIE